VTKLLLFAIVRIWCNVHFNVLLSQAVRMLLLHISLCNCFFVCSTCLCVSRVSGCFLYLFPMFCMLVFVKWQGVRSVCETVFSSCWRSLGM
jgi:hypothetical protein